MVKANRNDSKFHAHDQRLFLFGCNATFKSWKSLKSEDSNKVGL